MSLKSSGLWCDLCKKPILSGDWWNIGINGQKKGHSCSECKDKWLQESNLKKDQKP